MKKVFLIIGLIFCFAPNLFATTVVPLTCSNSTDGLSNGLLYATVTLTSQSPTCVQITVQPNTAILNPGTNFGVQVFGFNYKGTTTNLVISGLPSTWTYSIDPLNIDGFGKFEVEDTGGGQDRQNPLVFTVCCKLGTLAEADLIEVNNKGKCFVAHIAGFTNTPSGSAYFADGCPLTTTTTTTEPKTLIELSAFKAIPGNRQVILVWETKSEIDNAGFNIYRAEAEDVEYIQVNDSMIPAKASSMEGASYLFIDNSVKNRETYYYKLEDVDLNGATMMHGPVSAIPRFIFGFRE